MTRAVRRAFSLIEILVVIVIIAVLAAVLLPKYLSSSTTKGGKKVDAPINRAKGVECQSNLQQLRQSIQMVTMTDDENRPNSLAEFRLPSSMLSCPVAKTPYRYDPASRRVWCTYENHQTY